MKMKKRIFAIAAVCACVLAFVACKHQEEITDNTEINSENNVSSEVNEEIPAPEDLETTEKLFLAAVHLEQYRHATYSPEPYYLEGLRRDSSDIRLNNGYGKYLYNKGRFSESEKYFDDTNSITVANRDFFTFSVFFCILFLSYKKKGR